MEKVTVAVRCRPTTTSEKVRLEPCFDYFQDEDAQVRKVKTCLILNLWFVCSSHFCSLLQVVSTLRNKYAFNHVFTPESTQSDVFEAIGKPMIDKVIQGYNASILAYGQTGSGKSYSMGTEMVVSKTQTIKLTELIFPSIPVECFEYIHICLQNEGLAQKALGQLFEARNLALAVTSVEIYREEVYDLLAPKPMKLSVSQGNLSYL